MWLWWSLSSKLKWNPILLIWTWRKWNELTISRPWAWVCLDQIWCLTIIVALTMHVKRLVNRFAAGSKWSSIPLLPDLGGWVQLLVFFIGKTLHVVHFHPSRHVSIMSNYKIVSRICHIKGTIHWRGVKSLANYC